MIVEIKDLSKEELVAMLNKAIKQISDLTEEKNKLKEKLNETK